MDWKLTAEFFFVGSAGEFKSAANALLVWSAILLLLSDDNFLILLILFTLPQIAQWNGINYHSNGSRIRTGS